MSAVGEAWASNLEQQVGAWKAARSERTSATEAGVLVVPDAFAQEGQRFIGIDTCARPVAPPDHRVFRVSAEGSRGFAPANAVLHFQIGGEVGMYSRTVQRILDRA